MDPEESCLDEVKKTLDLSFCTTAHAYPSSICFHYLMTLSAKNELAIFAFSGQMPNENNLSIFNKFVGM